MPRNNNRLYSSTSSPLFSSIPLHQKHHSHHYYCLLLLLWLYKTNQHLVPSPIYIYISSTRTIILQPIRIGPPLEASIPKTTPSNKSCTSPPKITTITITITRATQDHSQTVPCFFFVFGILSYSSTVTADKISESNIYPGPAKPAREQRAFLQQTRKPDKEPFIHHESE